MKEDEPLLIHVLAHLKGAAYWQKGTKSNHYGIRKRNATPRNPTDATLSAKLSKISPSACNGYGCLHRPHNIITLSKQTRQRKHCRGGVVSLSLKFFPQ